MTEHGLTTRALTPHALTDGEADLSAFAIDRDLPVALGTQLRGVVEFGIGLGALRPGDRLPSVRDLADHLGIAPMTVAQVYGDMRRSGVIVSRPGNGTFVADIAPAVCQPVGDVALHRSIDLLIAQGRALGLRASDLVGLIAARAGTPRAASGRRRVVLVGHFAATTASYCAAMRAIVGDAIELEPVTLAAIRDDADERRRAAGADLVITFPHRRADIMRLLPHTAIAAMTFIPSSETRQALAALDPGERVAIVSVFPEFASVMKAAVRRFAPHVPSISVVLYDAADRDDVLRRAGVVVFATGADDLGLDLPHGVVAFEFRYTPDPADIRRLLLPLLDDERATPALERVS